MEHSGRGASGCSLELERPWAPPFLCLLLPRDNQRTGHPDHLPVHATLPRRDLSGAGISPLSRLFAVSLPEPVSS